ncbi:MAG TPA: hypothetical protein PLU35_09720 [Phycisphaerales bacterium]|nr:hypothetical protein [Phycisphaerales bacterium]
MSVPPPSDPFSRLRAGAPARADAEAWLRAARDPQVSGELELVYAAVAREAGRRNPVCTASGRCCRFEAWGHRLYTTGLEAAFTMVSIDPALVPNEAGVARALARGGCPFQPATLCEAHEHRPLGCRVYYCDPTAQEWQRALSERMLREVRDIHDRHGVPYLYAEWRSLLFALASLTASDGGATTGAGG